MSSPNYYGGYSLVRSSAQTAGSVSGAHAAKDTARPSGLSRINFASCNSDWMPSLATSSAAGVRSALAPAEAAAPPASTTTTTTTTTTTNNNNNTSSTRPTFLHAFLTMQNFYRGAPLRTTSSIAKMASTSATVASTTTAAEVKKVIVPTATGAATRTEAKKVLPVMPLPIGSDTWSAFSDPAFAAKSGVVATRHVLTRPVAPMAIGVTDDDLVTEKKILPRGPEPLFRDLPAFASLPETQNYNAVLTYNNNNNNDNNGIVMKEPVPVDGLFSFQQQEHHGHEKVDEQKQEHRPIPPVPISMSPLMSPHGEDALEAKDNVEIYQMRSDPSDVLSDEGQYVSRAVLKELNTDTFSRSPTPKEMQQESVSVPFFSGWTNNAAFSRSSNNQPQQQQSSLLREGDEETRLFDDDDDDAELERIKQLVNLVLSIGASENKSVAADVTCEPKSSLDAGMEWLNTRYNNNQPDTSFFHNI